MKLTSGTTHRLTAVGARKSDSSSRVSGVTVIAHTPVSSSTRATPVTVRDVSRLA